MNRTRTISTKVTPGEQARLLARAAALGVKPSDYYRQILLGDPAIERLFSLLVETYRLQLQEQLTPVAFETLVKQSEGGNR